MTIDAAVDARSALWPSIAPRAYNAESPTLSLSLSSPCRFSSVYTQRKRVRERERRSGSYMYNIPGSIRLIKPLWPSLFPFLLFFFSPAAIPNGDVLRRRRRLLYGEKSTTFGRSGAWDGGKQ